MKNTQKRVKQVIVNTITVGNSPISAVFILDNDENLYELRNRRIDKKDAMGKDHTEIELYWFKLPTLPIPEKDEKEYVSN
jgi:hypothetical protein